LGAGPLVTLVPNAIVGSAPPEQAGSAASLSSTSAELGGALSIAILGSIGAAVYRFVIAGAFPIGIPSEVAQIARGTLGGAIAVSRDLPSEVRSAMLQAAHGAFTQAFTAVALISAVLMVVAAILMAVVTARTQAAARLEISTSVSVG